MLNKNIDRRKYPRGRGDLEYLFAVEIDHKGRKIISEVKDISCGGLMCKVNQHFQPGKELTVAFLLPEYARHGIKFRRIKNKGLIIRCEHFPEVDDVNCRKLAIAFQNLNPQNEKQVSKFVGHAKSVEKRLTKASRQSPLHVENNCVMSR